ncbi:MAG: energy transducer TonB [Acidobacteriota bacterium]
MKRILALTLLLLAGLSVFSQDDPPAHIPDCSPAAKIDEFNFTSIKEDRERIDLFGLQIKNANAFAIVIGYGGKITESNEGRNVASEIEQYLTSKFKFTSYYTIALRDGGHRDVASVELFIKQERCGTDPEPSPSLTDDEVTYKEEKQFFDSSVSRVPSDELRGLLTAEPAPTYPPAARAVRASGKVVVLVKADEKGNVIDAMAMNGHPLLRGAGLAAVKALTFKSLIRGERAVKFGGKIVVDFDGLAEKSFNQDN